MSGETPAPKLPNCEMLRVPAHAERSLTIIWNGGRPRGLVVDGVYYAVKPSPRMRWYSGDWHQTLWEVLERP